MLLDLIAKWLPVAMVPELCVHFLGGDPCVDERTVEKVFFTKYTDHENHTFLDETLSVRHSFDDQPAVTMMGVSIWYFNGVIHRGDDKPALMSRDGTKEWWVMGKMHRPNGPAYLGPLQCSAFYLDGVHMYRDAIWYLHGKRQKSATLEMFE